MSEYVRSADGTPIAFDRIGVGPAVVLVGGASQFRALDPTTVELARRPGDRGHTVINYDRRGRGESGDTAPYAVEREIEDLEALLREVGGHAALFGSSSGAVLCLHAAAARIGATRLVLWEAPLALEGAGDGGRFLAGMTKLIDAGDRAGAVELFMSDMPPEWLAGLRSSPAWDLMLAIAPTLPYDAAVLDRAERSPWAAQWSSVHMPVLVLVGEETLPIFPPAADALVVALPDAQLKIMRAANHGWQPEIMCETIGDFLVD
jgi:pimeloyl-ACP methyl ester carboxylesterase